MRPTAFPATRPRRRPPSRGFGSNVLAARAGRARLARQTPARPRPAHGRSDPRPPRHPRITSASGSSFAPTQYRPRPGRKLGALPPPSPPAGPGRHRRDRKRWRRASRGGRREDSTMQRTPASAPALAGRRGDRPTAGPPGGQPSRLGWILGLTSAAYFMVVLDALVVVTALPRMQRDLHAGLAALQWTVNSYGIAFAAGIITATALGDRLGRRRVFIAGLALFTLASACCALAPGAPALIAARAVQGLGAAAVLPLSLTILTGAFPARRRGTVVGIYGGLAGLAVATGPLVGGAVTEGLDWHWIFWVNVPIGVAVRLLPESYGPAARLDLPGVALVSGGAVCLVWGLVRASQAGWGSPEIITTLAVGA